VKYEFQKLIGHIMTVMDLGLPHVFFNSFSWKSLFFFHKQS